jgi:hypothetical protein
MRDSGLHLSQVSCRGAAVMMYTVLYGTLCTLHTAGRHHYRDPGCRMSCGTEEWEQQKIPTHHNHNLKTT